MITDLSLSLATLGKIFIDAGDNCGPQNVLSNLNKISKGRVEEGQQSIFCLVANECQATHQHRRCMPVTTLVLGNKGILGICNV